jgi:FkbM family methyltransferase
MARNKTTAVHTRPGDRPLTKLAKLVMLLGPVQALKFIALRARGVHSAIFVPRGLAVPVECRLRGSDIFVMWQAIGKDECRLPGWVRPKVIIDGGANVGYTTARFASDYPESTVIAIEPAEDNLAILRRNVQRFANVVVIPGALWKSDATLSVINPTAQPWEYQVNEVPDDQSPGSFRAFTIPSLLQHCGHSNAEVVKLDVEGAEEMIFGHGPTQWIDGCQLVVVETHGPRATETVRHAFSSGFAESRQGEKLVFTRTGVLSAVPASDKLLRA